MPFRSQHFNKWQLTVGALIIFGTLYPFDFTWPQDVRTALHVFLSEAKLWSTRGDVAGNLILFIPWGALQPISQSSPTRHRRWHTFAYGITLSVVLQLLQIALPSRDAALSDVFWNGAGILVGQFAVRPMLNATIKPRSTNAGELPLGLIILGLWLLAEFAPLLPSFDLSLLKTNITAFLNPAPGSVAMLALAFGGILTAACALHTAYGPKKAIILLSLMLLLLPAAKLMILHSSLHWLALLGWTLGWAAAIALLPQTNDRLSWTAFGVLMLGLSLSGLEPFRLANTPNTFNWIPFVGFLEGDMLANVMELLQSVWLFSAILWLGAHLGGRLNGIGFFLIVWVSALEVAQIWLDGRSADITPSLTVLIVLLAMNALLKGERLPPPPTPAAPVARETQTTSQTSLQNALRARTFTVMAGIALWVTSVAAVSWLIRQPGIPYNLRELFNADGHPLAIAVFILALAWLGAGSWVAVSVAHRFQRAWLALPLTLIACSGISLLLLLISVTDESIMDIAGSNNLYWFVTNRDTWGTWWAGIFTAYLTPDLIAPFERTVRYIALYLPPAAFLAIALMLQPDTWGKAEAATVLKAGLVLFPLLWLCKGIAFDWSSTDNLNELIAPTGAFGMGGGAYLYLLIVLIAANMAVLGRTHSLRTLATTLLVTVFCLPLSWVLLTHGLSMAVEKYELIFSGTQFLLGPDRNTPMPESTLQLRWAAVYLALQLGGGLGIMLARTMMTAHLRENTPAHTSIS